MPLQRRYVDELTLRPSFEHAATDADTWFIGEAWRILRLGSSVCIAPSCVWERHEVPIGSDPTASLAATADVGARFQRLEDAAVLADPVVGGFERGESTFSLFDLEAFDDNWRVRLEHAPPDPARQAGRSFLRRAATARLYSFALGNRSAYSLGAFITAAALLVILVAGLEQPARAIGVLAFLGIAPWMIAGRFARGLGALETAVIGFACAVAGSGIMAGAALAAGIRAPRDALIALAAVLGGGALADLAATWKRKPETP